VQKPDSFCLADVCTALHCDFFSHFVSGHTGYGFGADAPCREAVVKKHRQLCEVCSRRVYAIRQSKWLQRNKLCYMHSCRL
jgi:hypothetical protein